jgi:hypothetical protein
MRIGSWKVRPILARSFLKLPNPDMRALTLYDDHILKVQGPVNQC